MSDKATVFIVDDDQDARAPGRRFEVRFVDRLGQALGGVGQLVAKIDPQLIRVA